MYQKKLFGASVLKRGDEKPTRFAFVISKKVNKNASQRNRIKRAMRESVRQSLTHTVKGYDLVFLAKKNIIKKLTEEIMRELNTFLREIKIVK
ncbi:ribonuclease P protein component [Candidatus Woesebacteria bacterium RBG_16_34_12]|uniref:Ribonuclease P protein component n=1 Tax=Candidatus Woesebacteria bacterium RBG_16_34_12 TaxID=1802480 RepID=A0A1F7X6Z0_9BACT|nr:MAG: ribonuclease P protein component [Candidatus Woesebacteria bacterium RBG_16_34_12]